jgi:hypothetical protein
VDVESIRLAALELEGVALEEI